MRGIDTSQLLTVLATRRDARTNERNTRQTDHFWALVCDTSMD